MGVQISNINAYFEGPSKNNVDIKRQVLTLAKKVIQPLIENGIPETISHILVATTCPDELSPSLGQLIKEEFIDHFSNSLSLDIVQGCAGGVTSMIIGSQLCQMHKSSVLIINADAAQKATSKQSAIHKIFGNGSFSCIINYNHTSNGLLHYKSKQYKGLSEVVKVKLGHDSDHIILSHPEDIQVDPRKHLGLTLNRILALKLYKNAESFYKEFVAESETPDIMILHQVNPIIMKHLELTFNKYGVKFINVSSITGNCGAASVGIALDMVKADIQNKKLMLCSFGTGGVITAGMWQC